MPHSQPHRSSSDHDPSAVDQISIIVVTRNAFSALQQTVRSVAELQDPRLTLCIVDGVSTDGTVDYLRSLNEPWLRWSSEPDRGIFDAMNKGWRTVPDNNLILYLGSGDRILSLPSSQDIAAAADLGHHVLVGHCMHGSLSVDSDWCDTLYYGCTIHHQAVLVRKSLHPDPPFDVSFKAYADWDFNARMFAAGVKGCQIKNFRSYADPNGVSSDIHLSEAVRVSFRHGGVSALAKALQRHVPIRYHQLQRRLRTRLSLRRRLGLPPRHHG